MKILIADDHALFRRGLQLLLRQLYPLCEVLEAEDVPQVLAKGAQLESCDLALLDLLMPGMEELQGLAEIRTLAPKLPVIMLSARAEAAEIRHALAAGARGYVLKAASDDTLRHAISLVMNGERYLPGALLDSDEEVAPAVTKLTERQRDTLALLSQGLSNKEIARHMGLLESTVKAHLKVILKKLGATNRTQAALIGAQSGLDRRSA